MSSLPIVVFETFGLLEEIFSYGTAVDLVRSSMVNRRFSEAARTDCFWRALALNQWEDKIGVKYMKGYREEEAPLFWRTKLSDAIVDTLSVRQIRSFFSHPLLKDEQSQLANCLEKREMKELLKVYMASIANVSSTFSTGMWFGSYASSVIDASRKFMTRRELTTKFGYDMYFKIQEDEIWEEAELENLVPYENHPGLLLYRHSICYFEDDGEFCMEMRESDLSQPTNLRWRWDGRHVQVGPYPPLTITRQGDWGFKLENVHVVLLMREETSPRSRV